MKVGSSLPALDGVTEWLNPSPQPAAAKGRPLLVHFWSINSEIAEANLPQLRELRDRRRREGLRVIAVHLPQTDVEKSSQAVRHEVARLNLTEPCAIDNDYKLRDAFKNESGVVPAYYLFDPDQKLLVSSTQKNGIFIVEDALDQMLLELRSERPFCPGCEFFLETEALYCSECGSPLTLPGSKGAHPFYKEHHSASLPTVRLVNPDPLIGQIVDEKYELVARVGEGGTSVVYRARRLHIGDEVAVKVMLPKLAGDAAALSRLRREAGAAAISHHANVIAIHDFGENVHDYVPAYVVMELVKGTPLGYLLEIGTRFSVERAERLMRQICAGVGAAHRRGIVHRDLKPDNILVVAPDDTSEFESVRVVDFGFAKLTSDASVEGRGTVLGTPFYMSPEQCLGQKVDTRSDVYSLGVMFYEMLCGERPFTSERVSGIINKHLYDDPPPMPESLGVPRRIAAGIALALSKNPGDRPLTATDLARQLRLI